MAVQTRTLLRIKQTEQKVGLGHSAIYEKLNPHSVDYDPSFPIPVRVGKKAVRWIEHELDLWIASCPRTRQVAANDDGFAVNNEAVVNGRNLKKGGQA